MWTMDLIWYWFLPGNIAYNSMGSTPSQANSPTNSVGSVLSVRAASNVSNKGKFTLSESERESENFLCLLLPFSMNSALNFLLAHLEET